MIRPDGSEMHDLQGLVARALFQDRFPMRSWERSKGSLQANSRKRAADALKRAGIPNVEIEAKVKNPKEGAR